ncbi:MAG TPA: methyltransferase domain-containing protein [Acidimicrobiales bacterium]|nr:methyltransferase domain-containing protein [Acidimicrobiales bacterium]
MSEFATRIDETRDFVELHRVSLAHHTEVLVRFEETIAAHNLSSSSLSGLAEELRELAQRMDHFENMANVQREITEAFTELENLRQKIADDRETADQTTAELQMRLARLDLFFEDYRRSLKSQPSHALVDETPLPPAALEGIYFALENAFRGSPDLIKGRLEVYLENVRTATGDDGVVLDVGCGRGEWLEMLRDEGISATGVDANDSYREQWAAAGLDVITANATDYMRTLQPGTIAVITAFHLVEHLPLDVMLELLDLANQLLRPGGLLILETPNPENLIVGASAFYLDPTHQRPIPPRLLEFLVHVRGFVDVEIARLQRGDSRTLSEPSEVAGPWVHDLLPIIELINTQLFAPQDYAVLAHHI